MDKNSKSNRKPLVVGITGASGIGYGMRLIEALAKYHKAPYIVLSESAAIVTQVETDYDIEKIKKIAEKVYSPNNIAAEIASGSFKVGGMVVCPCSMKTLGLIANGIESNLIVRATMCQLKEGRKVVLVPRETPLSLPIIENMKQAFLSGAVILPAMPGFYHKPKTIADLENFIVGKILDQFEIEHDLYQRWGSI